MTALVWFQRDLRLTDHPALSQALARHERVVPVFVLVTAGVGAVIFALWRGVAAGWL